ncbi:MAG TPA: hypothetical protein VK559_10905 [Ferruginibacter sp.]|nr:hypothetical protein [Ferruginibacter sp.]
MIARAKNSILFIIVSAMLFACAKKQTDTTIVPRTYRMGFQNFAPRPVFDEYIQSLNMWSTRADAAMISVQLPWDSLLAGVTPQAYITNNYSGVVNYWRAKNFQLWILVDPANGLDRSSDAPILVADNKSIAQTPIQQLYRNYVIALDTMLHPEHLGFALETNLIKGDSPDSIYQGIKLAANEAAADVRAVDAQVKFDVSVQVDYAWGYGNGGSFVGVDQVFTDFPFIQELGLSSYPYFSFSDPSQVPLDYYSRLVIGRSTPVFASEGGWTSANINAAGTIINSTPQKQQDYINREALILDSAKAIGWFSLTFTDIDLSAIPAGTNPDIDYFAYLGLVDVNFQPKPALSAWDAIFSRPLKPGN